MYYEDLKFKFTNEESREAYVTAWNKSAEFFNDCMKVLVTADDLGMSAEDRRQLLDKVNDVMLYMQQSIDRDSKQL